MKKRVRNPPHFTTGFGDGKVNVRNPTTTRESQIENKLRRPQAQVHDRDKTYPRERKSRDTKKQNDRPWEDAYFRDGRTNRYPRRGGIATLWESNSALALLAIVVLMSALFLHLLSDTNEKNLRRRRRRRQQQPIRINKKTDEWIDDAEDDSLEDHDDKKQRSSASERELPRPPAVYYHPYQPRLQQRQPHSKLPSTNVPVSSSKAASQAAAAAAAAARAQVSTGKPQPGDAFQPVGYMHSTEKTLYPSPTSNRRGVLSDAPLSPRTAPLGNQEEAKQNLRDAGLSPPAHATSQFPLPQRAVALPTDVSSFGSLTDTGPETSPHANRHGDEEFGSPKRSPAERYLNVAKNVKSNILLSPGTEDVEESRITKPNKKSGVDMLEKTPRVTNRQRPTMYSPKVQDSSEPNSAASSSMAFASPPRKQPKEKPEIPFVPNLEGTARSMPPLSVNVDELQLYRMESGNVSHWEARVAEESQIIQHRVYSWSTSEASDSKGNESDEKIPSNDPRGGIDHKREDLTDDTDAAASLQGAIDYDKLELIEVIGGGGFGQVWRAKLRGTPVAVKILTGSAQSTKVPKAVLEEFAAEINLLKGMQHPNICLYMGACVKPPHRAIVTELAENGSLWDALRLPLNAPYVPCDGLSQEGWPLSLFEPDARHGAPPATPRYKSLPMVPPRFTWPWALVKKVAVGVARGVAYLHGGNPPVLHRDLKSANVLLGESYIPKVCDFGLSRLKAHERSMTGNCGTVQWMAPEVLASQAYDEKADVYSYGIICWELLTRKCPYDGMTAIQCALAVLNRDQRPEIPKWCPPSLHALIRSCVKKNPDERPTFEQLIQALDSLPDA